MAWRELSWTDENEAHIWDRHRVVPDEVEQLVNSRPRYVKPGRDNTDWIYGTTNAGRHLLVVTTPSMDGLDYVVTARPMDKAEKREFHRHAR